MSEEQTTQQPLYPVQGIKQTHLFTDPYTASTFKYMISGQRRHTEGDYIRQLEAARARDIKSTIKSMEMLEEVDDAG